MNTRKKALSFCAATLMALSVIAAVPADASAEWVKTSSGYSYKDDTTGKKLTGWKTIDGSKFYFDKKGIAYSGFKTINNDTYYFIPTKRGKMATGWRTISKKRYYFGKDGVMRTGWVTLSGNKYYFTEKGYAATGNVKIDGTTYNFDSRGVLQGKATKDSTAKITFGTSYDKAMKTLKKRYDICEGYEDKFIFCMNNSDLQKDDVNFDVYVFDSSDKLAMYGSMSSDHSMTKKYAEKLKKQGYKYVPESRAYDFEAYETSTTWAFIYDTDEFVYYLVVSPEIVKDYENGDMSSFNALLDSLS
jgi:hypothetical protein